MKIVNKKHVIATILSVSAAFLMVGCNQGQDSATAGQKLDTAIAKTEKKTDAIATAASNKAHEVGNSISSTLDEAATTASIHAEMSKDDGLKSVAIDVDTNGNQVTLTGTAPDEAAKTRATLIAQNTQGVATVNNHITIAQP